MKLRNVGRLLLAIVVSVGFGIGVTSCSRSYTVGYMYVTGAQYNQISGFKINNQTGALRPIRNSPFGSNGVNPIRDIVLSGGRFLYVLNQGSFVYNSDGSSSGTASNVSLYQIGGDGVLTFQASYTSQGNNSISMLTDTSGTHLYILDNYASLDSGVNRGSAIPSSTAFSASTPCLNSADGRYYPNGDVSAYNIDGNTGRLSLVTNAQVANPDGTQLTYFPLGCFPIEFKLASGYIFTAQTGSTSNNDLQTIFSYTYSGTSGQLTLTQNAPLQTGATHMTTINSDSAGSNVYVLDAGPAAACTGNQTQILPFTVGSGGTLATQTGGQVCNDPTALNPNLLLVVSGGTGSKFLYVANSGTSTSNTSAESSISAFNIDPTTNRLAFIAGEPFTTGSGPRCMIEDPSSQFVYTANFNDSTIVGKIIDVKSGVLNPLRRATSYPTGGNPTWCTASSRTQ